VIQQICTTNEEIIILTGLSINTRKSYSKKFRSDALCLVM